MCVWCHVKSCLSRRLRIGEAFSLCFVFSVLCALCFGVADCWLAADTALKCMARRSTIYHKLLFRAMCFMLRDVFGAETDTQCCADHEKHETIGRRRRRAHRFVGCAYSGKHGSANENGCFSFFRLPSVFSVSSNVLKRKARPP